MEIRHERGSANENMAENKRQRGGGFLSLEDIVAVVVLPHKGQVEDVTAVRIPAKTIPPVLFAAINAHASKCVGYETEPDGSRSMILDRSLYLLTYDLRDEIILKETNSDEILESDDCIDELGDEACSLLASECERLFHGRNPAVAQLGINESCAPRLTIRVEVPEL